MTHLNTIHTITAALIVLLFSNCSHHSLHIKVSNDLNFQRNGELVSIPYNIWHKRLKSKNLEVINEAGTPIITQIDHTGSLLFPAKVSAKGSAHYYIRKHNTTATTTHAHTTCGNIYPERKDDVAWENNLIAYRAYGPSLWKSGERAYGYDVWTKSVPYPVVKQRYFKELHKNISYHKDHGDGMDCYKVGPTLGAGTNALFIKEKPLYPHCYEKCTIVDNGPLRFTMHLTFPTRLINEKKVTEHRIITLDHNCYFNRTTIYYDSLSSSVPMVVGIALHSNKSTDIRFNTKLGYIAYADPTDRPHTDNGKIFVGVITNNSTQITQQIFNNKQQRRTSAYGHLLIHLPQPNTYYWGAAWSKAKHITNIDKWEQYIQQQKKCILSPLRIDWSH